MIDTLHDYKTGQQLDGNTNKISPCPSLGLPFLRLMLAHGLATCVTQSIPITSTFTTRIICSSKLGVSTISLMPQYKSRGRLGGTSSSLCMEHHVDHQFLLRFLVFI